MRKFHAAAVGADEMQDINTYAVVLAERHDGAGMRLEIQKSLSFDDQDRVGGMDTYCLCTESGACHYGGVTRWMVGESSIEVLLDARASSALGVDGGFQVEVSGQYLPILREALQRLLGT
ncbi:hypothetical protein HRD49_06735 [Corallococcus exiguus]|uniref:Imm10 family immunity protein n=1 Tax=Corallococcus TaxID=83461 RepID=UPI000EA0655A|nr:MULTISPECIES: Imm10 family immunity protein [Corallococcus]NRD61444.1 hypothetical protein [Corallococcus exiguus]RKH22108.1 hypothetical protein D7V77_28020 [Corallococcus sp. CA041A]RUO95083.1 hypothetical protein D7Y11_01080 [Corallococcus sp. AB018]